MARGGGGAHLWALLGGLALAAALILYSRELRLPFVFSGAGVGLLVGLTGVGGGSLMTPLLILLFGIHPAAAVGVDLFFASATKATGSVVHAANRTVDWALVRRLAAGSLPATLLTLLLLKGLHLDAASHGKWLEKLLGIVLLLTVAALLLRGRLERLARGSGLRLPAGGATVLTVALGAVLGVMVTLTSVGAGALGVVVLVFLHPGLPLSRVVGSDIAHAVPLALLAGLGHLTFQGVDLGLLGSLLLGSIPGVVLGSALTPLAPEGALRLTLAAILSLSALKLLV